jgi:hypothetical protein
VVFLQYITTSHVDSRERSFGQKTETCYSEQKIHVSIIRHPTGFYVVERFPNDAKMNGVYVVVNLSPRVEQAIFPRGRAPHQKRLVIHLDNCSVHTNQASRDWLEEHDMRRVSHPRHWPDLAPCDFSLFPTMKAKLERTRVADKEHFLGTLCPQAVDTLALVVPSLSQRENIC